MKNQPITEPSPDFPDKDLGLYYLQSRYYDSEIGRFINADGTLNGNGDIMGFNMYAQSQSGDGSTIDS